MIHLLILAVYLLATIAKLLRPGGVRAVVAESLLLSTSFTQQTRHSIERSSASVASLLGPFSAAFITNIAEFDLRHTG